MSREVANAHWTDAHAAEAARPDSHVPEMPHHRQWKVVWVVRETSKQLKICLFETAIPHTRQMRKFLSQDCYTHANE
ncbi:hypothetical protein EVAR_89115_1 [Eumeta japonica]|uniref:Uncharacterized protein n=1 Tax=Eumeta variegata TaxID=151549 RepID=A0A4C1ZRV2_EUMVA|nr:hypothetical protein EVAR_89115_1 [Eumeta japonica]